MKERAEQQADHQRVAYQIAPHILEQQSQAARRAPINLALRPFHRDCSGNHHHRQVDGQQQRQCHDALTANDARDQWQADEYRVGKGRRDACKHRNTRIALEKQHGDQVAAGPGNRNTGEIDDPEQPGLRLRKIGFGDGTEKKHGDGDLENKIA